MPDEAVSTTPERDQLIATLQALVASNQAQIDARDRVIAMLRAQLARLRRMTFGALAHVVVAKFDHHLPLYRQAEMMAAQGVDIDRSTDGQALAPL